MGELRNQFRKLITLKKKRVLFQQRFKLGTFHNSSPMCESCWNETSVYYAGLWQCSPGNVLRRGSICWYISGMPASRLIGRVFKASTPSPKRCFICTTLVLAAWFIYASLIHAEQPPLTSCPRNSSKVQEGKASSVATLDVLWNDLRPYDCRHST
jgi:hypothetical protein